MRYGGVEVELYPFLASALDSIEWSASPLGRFITGEKSPVLID
jgi:hypothetical protein